MCHMDHAKETIIPSIKQVFRETILKLELLSLIGKNDKLSCDAKQFLFGQNDDPANKSDGSRDSPNHQQTQENTTPEFDDTHSFENGNHPDSAMSDCEIAMKNYVNFITHIDWTNDIGNDLQDAQSQLQSTFYKLFKLTKHKLTESSMSTIEEVKTICAQKMSLSSQPSEAVYEPNSKENAGNDDNTIDHNNENIDNSNTNNNNTSNDDIQSQSNIKSLKIQINGAPLENDTHNSTTASKNLGQDSSDNASENLSENSIDSENENSTSSAKIPATNKKTNNNQEDADSANASKSETIAHTFVKFFLLNVETLNEMLKQENNPQTMSEQLSDVLQQYKHLKHENDNLNNELLNEKEYHSRLIEDMAFNITKLENEIEKLQQMYSQKEDNLNEYFDKSNQKIQSNFENNEKYLQNQITIHSRKFNDLKTNNKEAETDVKKKAKRVENEINELKNKYDHDMIQLYDENEKIQSLHTSEKNKLEQV